MSLKVAYYCSVYTARRESREGGWGGGGIRIKCQNLRHFGSEYFIAVLYYGWLKRGREEQILPSSKFIFLQIFLVTPKTQAKLSFLQRETQML